MVFFIYPHFYCIYLMLMVAEVRYKINEFYCHVSL